MSAIQTIKSILRPFKHAVMRHMPIPPMARTPNNGWFDVPPDFHPSDYMGLWSGKYEEAESTILAEDFKPDNLIIEIGGNIGVVSRIACETKLRPQGTYVCIEANPKAIPYLESNLAEARTRRDIHVVPAAIGAPTVDGEQQVFLQRKNLSSGLGDTLKPQAGEVAISVPVISLSSVVHKFDRARQGYSLICDAEGAEILILQKDQGALAGCRQIAIELHHPSLTGSSVTPDDMVVALQSLGFAHRRQLQDTHYFRRPSF